MEFKTAKSHYITFCLMLAGIVIGILMGALFGKVIWPVVLILSVIILTPYLCFNIILSVNIVDDHLVVKTTQLFREKTTLINIKEVELQLFYTPPKPRRKGFYSMHVIRNNKVIHEIEYDVNKLSAFIQDFNQKRSEVSG
jgi:hypothetical protein